MLLAFKNSKRYPVTAQWPAKQPVYARTKATAGSRGAVLLGQGSLKEGQVWVEVRGSITEGRA